MKHLFKVTILTLAMLCCYTMISEAKVKKTRKARTEKRITKTPSLSSKEIGSETMNDSQKTTNEREYVDLGLPSGTLWATMNVGANHPEDYGDYFAWGEITTKDDFTWRSYRLGSGYNFLYKYCTSGVFASGGKYDNKTELDFVDDAAYKNWGKDWRIPSLAQIKELGRECSWQWTFKNGVNGYIITSNRNGNSIFLPAAGCRDESKLYNAGSVGQYWTRTLNEDFPNTAYLLVFGSSGSIGFKDISRYQGRSIRAVRMPHK